MGEAGERGASRRYPRIVSSVLITLALVGCGGLGLLPYRSETQNSGFGSLAALKKAYRSIKPGTTLASDLSGLGFDAARGDNVQVLSYLGVIERFMPRDSLHFDKLAPAVQACIDARNRCTGYVFRTGEAPESRDAEATGGFVTSSRAAAATWSQDVVLLVQDGRVAYKAMPRRGARHAGG